MSVVLDPMNNVNPIDAVGQLVVDSFDFTEEIDFSKCMKYYTETMSDGSISPDNNIPSLFKVMCAINPVHKAKRLEARNIRTRFIRGIKVFHDIHNCIIKWFFGVFCTNNISREYIKLSESFHINFFTKQNLRIGLTPERLQEIQSTEKSSPDYHTCNTYFQKLIHKLLDDSRFSSSFWEKICLLNDMIYNYRCRYHMQLLRHIISREITGHRLPKKGEITQILT